MKDDLGMRFTKVKDISWLENSTRNLILRQQFAKVFLQKAEKAKRIINIDETWLGMQDFRRTKWTGPHRSESWPKKAFAPRISLLLALDNSGRSYVALS